MKRPEDDPDYIPQMPDGYGREFLDDGHRNIEDMTEKELRAHDIRVEG